MPNWCDDRLRVQGAPQDVAEFVSATTNANGGLQFKKLAPPAEPSGEEGDWYNAQVDAWGTKWDVNDDEGTEAQAVDFGSGVDSEVVFYFQTAWSPPLEWLDKAASMYPSLTLTLAYDESMMDFAGLIRYENGVVVKEWEGESQTTGHCAVPECEETYYRNLDYNWDEGGEEPEPWFCEDHELEAEVFEAVKG